MEIKNIDLIESSYKYTIPLSHLKTNDKLILLHGTNEKIKISEFNNSELNTILIHNWTNEIFFRSILFKQFNEEILLIVGFKSLNIKVFKLSENRLELIQKLDLSQVHSILDLDIFSLKNVEKTKDLILIGSDKGLFIYSLKINNKLGHKKTLSIPNVRTTKLYTPRQGSRQGSNKYIALGLEKGIKILDLKFNVKCNIKIDERVYDLDFYDFDKCGINEIISCTRKGNIFIHKFLFEENQIKNYKEIYNQQFVFKKDCGRNKNPAINTFILKDLEPNGRINLIIGGHDRIIKVLEWNSEKTKFKLKLNS